MTEGTDEQQQEQQQLSQSQFNNELKGALFPNDKGGNERRPDYRGRCTIETKEYRISGWIRTARNSGQQFLSLAFTPNEEPQTKDEEKPF